MFLTRVCRYWHDLYISCSFQRLYHWKLGAFNSQFYRFLRTCSSKDFFVSQLFSLIVLLKNKGYPLKILFKCWRGLEGCSIKKNSLLEFIWSLRNDFCCLLLPSIMVALAHTHYGALMKSVGNCDGEVTIIHAIVDVPWTSERLSLLFILQVSIFCFLFLVLWL
jgi:hypothetical protein